MYSEVIFGGCVFIFGAYLGALADRACYWLHVSRTLIWRVHCVGCFTPHTWSTYVPIFGSLLSRGACLNCKQPLPVRPFLVELLGAATLLALWWFGFGASVPYGAAEWFLLAAYALLVCGFLMLFVSDLAYDELPVFVYLITFGVLLATLMANLSAADVFVHLFAGFIAGVIMLLLLVLSNWKWIHGHDILLAVLMGLLVSVPNIFVTLALTYICAVVGGLVAAGWKPKRVRGVSFFGVYLFVALCIQGLLAVFASLATL